MYSMGQGVIQDYKESVRLYKLSAAKGEDRSKHLLGFSYLMGQGVTQDYVRAHMWFNLAASSLSGEDQKNASTQRENVAAKMAPAQIAEAQAMARKCQASNFKQCD
jgi:TPR repeat protein